MANLYTRIRRRIDMTCKDLASDLNFSPGFALARLGANLCGRAGLRSIAASAGQKKDAFIHRYLEEVLEPVLQQYADDDAMGAYEPNAPIWVCWWTGEETAPPLVRQCIRSIREHAGDHPVHFITGENYRDFLQIPEYMLEKVEKKQMGLAHLADYIRVKLLAEQGGLWLDATIFCSNTVPESCFDIPFFTSKSPRQPCGYLSEMRWVTFCLGGWKGNVFFRFLRDAFERYWHASPCAIDYLFFDYIIDLAYNRLPALRKLIDAVPENNLHRDDLQAAMNDALPASEFDRVIQPDTVLYKLSWRECYAEKTADGEDSIFKAFVRGDLFGN